MVRSWKKMLGKAKCRWVPPQQVIACHTGGTTSGLCPSGALPPPRASAIRAALLLSGAALHPDKGLQNGCGALTPDRQMDRLTHI